MPRKETEFKWERPKTLVETAKRLPKRLRWALAPFEWLADWTLYGFDRVALVRLTVQSVLAVSIVGGVIALAVDLSDRDDERILRAWKVLSDAKAGGNFGQKNAVQFLHNRGQSLQKIVLKDAALAGIDLHGADLIRADLTGADLRGANLTGADLTGSKFQGANFYNAKLQGADLTGADLRGAALIKADLSKSTLRGANLSKAFLSGANLIGADLNKAYLSRANLSKAFLSGAILDGANLVGVRFCRTVMPDGSLKAPNCKLP